MDSRRSPRVITLAVPPYAPKNEPSNPPGKIYSKPRMRVFKHALHYSFTITDDDDVDTSFLDSVPSDDDDDDHRRPDPEFIDLVSSDDDDDDDTSFLDSVPSDDDDEDDHRQTDPEFIEEVGSNDEDDRPRSQSPKSSGSLEALLSSGDEFSEAENMDGADVEDLAQKVGEGEKVEAVESSGPETIDIKALFSGYDVMSALRDMFSERKKRDGADVADSCDAAVKWEEGEEDESEPRRKRRCPCRSAKRDWPKQCGPN